MISNYYGLSCWLKFLILGIIFVVLIVLLVNVAKYIFVGYEGLNIFILVLVLENYVKNGEINYELVSYMLFLEVKDEEVYWGLLEICYNFLF